MASLVKAADLFNPHHGICCRHERTATAPAKEAAKPESPVLPEALSRPCNTARTSDLEIAYNLATKVAATGPEISLLAKEFAIFNALIYKSKSQHRRTLSFKRLYEVNPGECQKKHCHHAQALELGQEGCLD